MNYYEHHIGDYAEATAHLTFVEDAAYTRLIRKYYSTEQPLPADKKIIERLVGARTKEEKKAVSTVLDEFFFLDADGWHNRRCDEEISRFQDKQAKAKRSAEARWNRPKSHTEGIADAMRTHSEGNAHQTPDTRHQTPVTNIKTHTEDIPPVAPSLAAAVCVLAKAKGIGSVNPQNAALVDLLERGASIAMFEAAADITVQKHKGFAYLLGVVKGQMDDATALANAPRASPVNGQPYEAPWERASRERMQALAPGAARKAPGDVKSAGNIIDEVRDAVAIPSR